MCVVEEVCGVEGAYLGCSVHRQQSTRTKSPNGGQVYNNTTFSVCGGEGVVCVCVWRERVQCVLCVGGGGESVGRLALSHLSNIRGSSK